MSEHTKDVFIRAGKTFWQAALAYLLADAAVLQQLLGGMSGGRHALLTLLVGAAAAGFSALYNGVIAPWLEGGYE